MLEINIEKIEVHYHGCNVAALAELRTLGGKIMSAISEFADKMKVHNEKIGAAIDGLVADVGSLNAKIAELQNSQGQITPNDQAKLDEIEAAGKAVADKLQTLDAATPPPVPPVQ